MLNHRPLLPTLALPFRYLNTFHLRPQRTLIVPFLLRAGLHAPRAKTRITERLKALRFRLILRLRRLRRLRLLFRRLRLL